MKYAFINGNILDGTENMQAVKGQAIITSGEKIESIRPKEKTDTKGCEIIDLQGGYIMPGLINLHVHVPSTGSPKKKASDAKKRVGFVTRNAFFRFLGQKLCEGYVKDELMSGTTTIRTVGGILDWDSRVRDRISAGKALGPRMLTSDMAISVPGGHMAGSLAYEAHSPKEAAELVHKIAEGKPDLIKLMITGGVLDATVKGEPGALKMPPEYVKAACDEAHKLHFRVAAHVESPEGVRVALENGVDTIEHGAAPDEDIIRLFHEKKAALVTTISPALPYALFDRSVSHATEMSQYNGKVVFDGIIECARACLRENIPVGLGTDTGCDYVTHYNTWREVLLFRKYCGVSNAFALYTATRRNAEIAGIGDITGTLEAGKCADLIVTRENPLENLRALSRIEMVMSGGQLHKNPVVKKFEAVERELDKFM